MKKGYRTIVAVVSLFLLVLIDQVTKFAAVKCLKGKEAFSLIPGVFELQYLENRGAAFGALQNQRWFFILIVIFVLAVFSNLQCCRYLCDGRYGCIVYIDTDNL